MRIDIYFFYRMFRNLIHSLGQESQTKRSWVTGGSRKHFKYSARLDIFHFINSLHKFLNSLYGFSSTLPSFRLLQGFHSIVYMVLQRSSVLLVICPSWPLQVCRRSCDWWVQPISFLCNISVDVIDSTYSSDFLSRLPIHRCPADCFEHHFHYFRYFQ